MPPSDRSSKSSARRRGRRRRRRGGLARDPLTWSPLDRARAASGLGLATVVLGLLHGLWVLAPAAEQRVAATAALELAGLAGLTLAALWVVLLGVARPLRSHPKRWPRFANAAAAGLVATGLWACAVAGFAHLTAGALLLAVPATLFASFERRTGQVGSAVWGAAFMAALVVDGGLVPAGHALAAFGLPAWPGLVDGRAFGPSVAAAPLAIAGAWLTGRALLRFREREAHVRKLSAVDEITVTANRRFFLEHATREVARSIRYGRPLSVVMVELHGLRALNDAVGYAAGDSALRATAGLLRGALRTHDLVGRYGGSQFALLLPETDTEGALVVAERCRARMSAMVVENVPSAYRLYGSVGMATFPSSGVANLDQLLAAAHGALDEAAREGGDRVRVGSRRSSEPGAPSASSPPIDSTGARVLTPDRTAEPIPDLAEANDDPTTEVRPVALERISE